MVRQSAALFLALLLAGPAIAATRQPLDSWGKSGVSLDQYHADAITCAQQGYFRDISQTEDAKAFVRGSRELDDATQSGWQAAPNQSLDDAASYASHLEQIKLGVQPDRRMRHIGQLLQTTVDQCLVARGYRRFRLTKAQRHDLGRMPIGAAERRSYLYKLASDPAVLRDQAEWYVGPIS